MCHWLCQCVSATGSGEHWHSQWHTAVPTPFFPTREISVFSLARDRFFGGKAHKNSHFSKKQNRPAVCSFRRSAGFSTDRNCPPVSRRARRRPTLPGRQMPSMPPNPPWAGPPAARLLSAHRGRRDASIENKTDLNRAGGGCRASASAGAITAARKHFPYHARGLADRGRMGPAAAACRRHFLSPIPTPKI